MVHATRDADVEAKVSEGLRLLGMSKDVAPISLPMLPEWLQVVSGEKRTGPPPLLILISSSSD
jgi:hypothetical protein